MVLHIGEDQTVPVDKLIMIANAAGMTPATRAYINRAIKERRYAACQGAVKAYVLVDERKRIMVYASMIAPATLERRLADSISRKGLFEAAVLTAE